VGRADASVELDDRRSLGSRVPEPLVPPTVAAGSQDRQKGISVRQLPGEDAVEVCGEDRPERDPVEEPEGPAHHVVERRSASRSCMAEKERSSPRRSLRVWAAAPRSRLVPDSTKRRTPLPCARRLPPPARRGEGATPAAPAR